MNKKEIISILHSADILQNIDYGPTAISVKSGKKNLFMLVKREGNYICVSTGRILKRTIRIPVDKL